MAGINWLISMLRRATSGTDDSGDYMTADRALSYAPVWYAVSKITGAFMIMPLNVHRAVGREKSVQTKHPSYRLMRWRPNAYQTPAAFKRQMMCHALLWGNARAYIHRDGLMSELIPLMPDRTETMLVDGEKVHFTKVDRDDRLDLWDDIKQAMEAAKETGQTDVIALRDDEVFHIPGLGFDGVNGKSLISLAAQSWGVGLGAESQERKKQRKGYAGGLMLEAPPDQMRKEEEAREFLKFFRETHDGEDNAGKTGLLTRGVTAKVMAMSNQDAQFIEQRRFQREDAALWFVLDAILGDSSNASYASSSEKNLAYRVNCLAPWTTAWEEEAELKLLTESERNRGYYFKFNDGALLRTEKAATMAFISQGRTCGVLSQNDGREMLDMNPIPDGDTYENPAISPGGASNQPKNPAKKAENRAMLARLQHLLKVEAKQMVKACSAANFVDKVDALYAKWLKTWTETLGEELATKHCEAAKAAILGCGDRAKTAEELTAAVTECVASWPDRAKELLNEMELVTC